MTAQHKARQQRHHPMRITHTAVNAQADRWQIASSPPVALIRFGKHCPFLASFAAVYTCFFGGRVLEG